MSASRHIYAFFLNVFLLAGCFSPARPQPENKENSNDFTFLYDRNNIYSNIQNGLGIFGAKLSYHLPSAVQAGRRNDYQPYIPDILK